jgi:hypothetical protein
MTYTFGASDDILSNDKWLKSGMTTHGSAILFNVRYPDGIALGIFKNLTTVKHGCEHAEDVFIRVIKQDKLGMMVPSPQVNRIILNLSKSPCSSTYGTSNKPRGCAEELINFQNQVFVHPVSRNEYVFKLIVIARGVYKQEQGSHDALDMMRSQGIEVTTDAHRKANGQPARKEYV